MGNHRTFLSRYCARRRDVPQLFSIRALRKPFHELELELTDVTRLRLQPELPKAEALLWPDQEAQLPQAASPWPEQEA